MKTWEETGATAGASALLCVIHKFITLCTVSQVLEMRIKPQSIQALLPLVCRNVAPSRGWLHPLIVSCFGYPTTDSPQHSLKMMRACVQIFAISFSFSNAQNWPRLTWTISQTHFVLVSISWITRSSILVSMIQALPVWMMLNSKN